MDVICCQLICSETPLFCKERAFSLHQLQYCPIVIDLPFTIIMYKVIYPFSEDAFQYLG